MTKTARVDWIEGYKLEGLTDNGKKVMMDTGENASAASPAQLLLQSLAGCTMMDCVLIISKSRKKIDKFWVDVAAEESEGHPKIFEKIHLTYNFLGAGLDDEIIKRAISLSEEKYCRVHAMLCKISDITSSYNLNK
ncbi:MAG TPA: OsmC family protein [Ignavibacteria bacterium]|nr:OsmC family protein [Ignavibacteria bacterium]HMQ97409.1 OsmC family protein [Ignavibacteria bacterium]